MLYDKSDDGMISLVCSTVGYVEINWLLKTLVVEDPKTSAPVESVATPFVISVEYNVHVDPWLILL